MDPELVAMQKISEALSELDVDGRQRVVSWALAKYGPTNSAQAFASRDRQVVGSLPGSAPMAFEDFAELFHAVDPKDNATRALVAAFWLSSQSDGGAFAAQAANSLLKEIGYHVPNITDALSQNMREKPASVIQTRKSGSSRQARKLYKVTDAGRRKVESFLGEGYVSLESR